MSEKIPELLAPAGNIEILKQAALFGADAIYFGGELFSARAYAGNLTNEEILSAIRFLHMNQKKAYLTVNTLLKSREIEGRLFSFLKPFYEEGLDAVLVQDMGVFSLIRDCFPNLPIHISTQCSVTSEYGARFFKSLGAERVVLSRELSLDEIKTVIEKSDIETEVFVHGALCVSYSGRCMMSSMIGGRSANRGRCAGACRNPYSVEIDGKKIESFGNYPLSMRDLSGLPDLKRLVKTGVDSLKIEGRMKDMTYVTGVVSLYRKYLDMLSDDPDMDYSVESNDLKRLFSLGNRGFFTDIWYFSKNDPSMTNSEDSSFKRDIKDEAKSYEETGLPVDITFKAHVGEPLLLSLKCKGQEVSVPGPDCEAAKNSPLTKESLSEKLSRLDTKNTYFEAGRVDILLSEEAPFVPMSILKEMKREGLSKLSDSFLEKRSDAFSPESAGFERSEQSFKKAETFMLISNTEQLSWLSALKHDFSVIIPSRLFLMNNGPMREKVMDSISSLQKTNKKIYLLFPRIFRKRVYEDAGTLLSIVEMSGLSGIFVTGYDALSFLLEKGFNKEKIFLSPDIYVMNERAKAFFGSLSLFNSSVPLELNEGEISHRDNSSSMMMVYGRYTLMQSAVCIYKNACGCEKNEEKEHAISLTDRKNMVFPVMKDCSDCVNLVLNSLPTNLFPDLPRLKGYGISRYLLSFTTENKEEMKKVIEDYYLAPSGSKSSSDGSYTRGHFGRGVE